MRGTLRGTLTGTGDVDGDVNGDGGRGTGGDNGGERLIPKIFIRIIRIINYQQIFYTVQGYQILKQPVEVI